MGIELQVRHQINNRKILVHRFEKSGSIIKLNEVYY